MLALALVIAPEMSLESPPTTRDSIYVPLLPSPVPRPKLAKLGPTGCMVQHAEHRLNEPMAANLSYTTSLAWPCL